MMKNKLNFLPMFAFLLPSMVYSQQEAPIVGAEQTEEYFPALKNKRVALFSNHTGIAGGKHILDVLIENGFNVVAVFSLNKNVCECVKKKSNCHSFIIAGNDPQSPATKGNSDFRRNDARQTPCRVLPTCYSYNT